MLRLHNAAGAVLAAIASVRLFFEHGSLGDCQQSRHAINTSGKFQTIRDRMTIAALIVAAGRGTRANSATPKQWCDLGGRTVADITLSALRDTGCFSAIVLVLHADDMKRRAAFEYEGVIVAKGGADRAESVRKGLAALDPAKVTKVLIHDVARPCVTGQIVRDVIAALDTAPGAAPALPVSDALWTGKNGRVTGAVDRRGLYRAQTPQGFELAAIRAAHAAHPGGAADDVEVARAAGLAVAIVPGDDDNLKITLPGDFDRAERILRARNGH
jgi:2-C-methyl-D-erythritol 4-phosphate cytidylyltransferase